MNLKHAVIFFFLGLFISVKVIIFIISKYKRYAKWRGNKGKQDPIIDDSDKSSKKEKKEKKKA